MKLIDLIVSISLVVYLIGYGAARAILDPRKWNNRERPPACLLAALWPAIAVLWVPVKAAGRVVAFGSWLGERSKRDERIAKAEVHRGG